MSTKRTCGFDSDGVVRVQFANPHGDVVATATLGQTGLDNYIETDEYEPPRRVRRLSSLIPQLAAGVAV
jgi:hypothetical protein